MGLEAQDIKAHYAKHKLDAVDVADEWGLDRYLFSAIKYIQRRGNKQGQTLGMDMAKAIWYITYHATGSKQLADDLSFTVLVASTKEEKQNE